MNLFKLYIHVNTYINVQDNYTPLHFAAYNGHTPVVELLIKLGASIDALTKVNYIYLY